MESQTEEGTAITKESNIIDKEKNDNKEEIKSEIKTQDKEKNEDKKKEKIKDKKKDKKEKNKDKKSEKGKENKEKLEEDHVGLWKCWKEHTPSQIPGCPQITLMGWSVAALRTNFYIKELGLMLDAGLSGPVWTINHLLITHCHSDHIANLPFHLYSYKPPEKIKIYIPKGIEVHIKAFIESAYLLSSHTFPEEENIKREDLYVYGFFDLISVEPGNIIPIQIKKVNYGLEIFKCYHQVPCVGYGVYNVRKKLKEEYSNLSGKEIGELRKNGVEINYDYISKMFVYLGDTGREIFEDENWKKIMEYPTIIIECTFILEDEKEQAIKTQHIHWDDLEPIVDKYNKNTFILIHFSQRYDNSEIKKFFEEKNRNNVIPWV